ncbi:MAG: hypothetical protein V3V03_04360 [Hyphomonadaceae bacterium]
MICRKWTTWTTKGDAPKYAEVFQSTVLPDLTAGIDGFKGANMLMLKHGDEMEITTLLWFDSIDAVKQFAGADYTKAVTPPGIVRAFMLRYDHHVEHHTVLI